MFRLIIDCCHTTLSSKIFDFAAQFTHDVYKVTINISVYLYMQFQCKKIHGEKLNWKWNLFRRYPQLKVWKNKSTIYIILFLYSLIFLSLLLNLKKRIVKVYQYTFESMVPVYTFWYIFPYMNSNKNKIILFPFHCFSFN